ncbi:MAG: type II secretion system protein [Planctomycetes bacterium]|nr:type II secretion system protein [Planctomycetota bacterium]
MLREKGFTLIEFMVVILVVAILAAVAIPIMRGRVDAAKWSEGKAMAGTVATALRAFAAEEGKDAALTGIAFSSWNDDLGFAEGELTGTYFNDADFTISDFVYGPPLEFTITVGTSADNAPATPDGYTLDNNGDWKEQ